jgi:hypothetical protein
MSSTKLHDVFDEIKQIHHQAAACCGEGAHSSDERLNLLADFFREWEERLEGYVDSLEGGERKAVFDTWVQFAPTEAIDKALSSLRCTQCNETGVFVDRCFELQEEIVTVLGDLANSLDAPNVRQLVLDVAKFEQQAARRLGAAELTEYDA